MNRHEFVARWVLNAQTHCAFLIDVEEAIGEANSAYDKLLRSMEGRDHAVAAVEVHGVQVRSLDELEAELRAAYDGRGPVAHGNQTFSDFVYLLQHIPSHALYTTAVQYHDAVARRQAALRSTPVPCR